MYVVQLTLQDLLQVNVYIQWTLQVQVHVHSGNYKYI